MESEQCLGRSVWYLSSTGGRSVRVGVLCSIGGSQWVVDVSWMEYEAYWISAANEEAGH